MKIKTLAPKDPKYDDKSVRKVLPSSQPTLAMPTSALPRCSTEVHKPLQNDFKNKCHLPSKKNTLKEPTKAGKKKLINKEDLPTRMTKTLLPGKKMKALNQQKGRKVHRMASLNALAKVHILYENECRGLPTETNESDTSNEIKPVPIVEKKITLLPPKIVNIKKEPKPLEVLQPKEVVKVKPTTELLVKKGKKAKVKTRKRKAADNVEIIDTRACKRLASLNAQAILAASYLPERGKREKKLCKIDEITFDKKEIVTMVNESITTTQVTNQLCTIITQKPSSKETNVVHQNNSVRSIAKDPKPIANSQHKTKQRSVPDSHLNKMDMSEYTEVTKVHINTTKALQMKQEGKHILEKDDVAIMYRYQTSKGTRQRYCVEMHTSYKPNKSISPPSKQMTPPPPPPSVHGPPPPGSTYYHGYGPPNLVPHMEKNYAQAGRVNGVPLMAMSRHYGSAFTVPHYGVSPHSGHTPPQHVSYPSGTEYGYYQPPGPMAQPVHDPCLIHKPVAYHAQHLGPSNSPSSPSSHPSPAHHPPIHSHPPSLPSQPPPAHTGYPPPEPPCLAHSGSCHALEPLSPYQQPSPIHPSAYPPSTPYHCQAAVQSPCVYTPGTFQDYGPSSPPTYQVLSPMAPNQSPPHQQQQQQQQQQQASSPHPLSLAQNRIHTPPRPATGSSVAVPKTEPTTPPEIKPLSPNGFIGNNGNYTVFQQADFPPTPLDDSVVPVKEIYISNEKCSKQVCAPKPKERTSQQPSVSSGATKTPTGDETSNMPVNSQPFHRQRIRKQNETLPASCRKLRSTSSSAARQAEQRRNVQVVKQKLKEPTKEKPLPLEVKESKRPVVVKEPGTTVKRLKKNSGSGSSTSSQSESSREAEAAPVLETDIPLNICSSQLALSRRKGQKKFSNGWAWEGEPFEKLVFLSNDDSPCLRRCYPCMRHIEGDTINVRDCVLLRSGQRKTDLPFVAKVAALWETPEEGEMMMSLMWYYRPEHTEQGRRVVDMEDEIFASKHRDANSVACIEDKCYVLTFTEYCRYRGRIRLLEDNVPKPIYSMVPEADEGYPRKLRMPPGRVAPEMVFFCRKVYDFRQKRILKNPV